MYSLSPLPAGASSSASVQRFASLLRAKIKESELVNGSRAKGKALGQHIIEKYNCFLVFYSLVNVFCSESSSSLPFVFGCPCFDLYCFLRSAVHNISIVLPPKNMFFHAFHSQLDTVHYMGELQVGPWPGGHFKIDIRKGS
jgi:hypothetical protein